MTTRREPEPRGPGNAKYLHTRVDAASAESCVRGATERGRRRNPATPPEPSPSGREGALEPLLTPAEVCRLLRISEKTLYRWAYLSRHGEQTGPQPIKIGGANRYRRRDVYAFMNPEPSP